jgi:hypothetical protein
LKILDFIIFLKQIQRFGFDPFVLVLHRSDPIPTTNLLQ